MRPFSLVNLCSAATPHPETLDYVNSSHMPPLAYVNNVPNAIIKVRSP